MITSWTGDDLRSWRRRHHLTQVQAAALMGIGERGWQRRESGDVAITSETVLACMHVDKYPFLAGGSIRRVEESSPDVVCTLVKRAVSQDDVSNVIFYTKIRDRRTAPCAHRVCVLIQNGQTGMLFDQGENHVAAVGSPRRKMEVEEMVSEALKHHPGKVLFHPEKRLSFELSGPPEAVVAALVQMENRPLTSFSELYAVARHMDPDVL